jgi:hypothetical protein
MSIKPSLFELVPMNVTAQMNQQNLQRLDQMPDLPMKSFEANFSSIVGCVTNE